jgi:hypothetical protein
VADGHLPARYSAPRQLPSAGFAKGWVGCLGFGLAVESRLARREYTPARAGFERRCDAGDGLLGSPANLPRVEAASDFVVQNSGQPDYIASVQRVG